jgi:hypothetical protein
MHTSQSDQNRIFGSGASQSGLPEWSVGYSMFHASCFFLLKKAKAQQKKLLG